MDIRRYESGDEAAVWRVVYEAFWYGFAGDYHPELIERWAPRGLELEVWRKGFQHGEFGEVVGGQDADLTGEPIMESLHLATAQDREIGKDLVDLVKGFDLVLRDMGYFGTAEFGRIESRDAFWLSRLPVSVKANDLEGRKLETILRTTKAKEIDCNMSIGDVCHPARLIAVRSTPEVARERRRQRREQARKVGKQLSIENIAQDLAGFILTLVSIDRFADYNPDPRHLKMDKRSRKSLGQTATECLS